MKKIIKSVLQQYIFKDRLIWNNLLSNNSVNFTFDDGPHPVYTLKVLDVLDELRGKGTFFVLGENVEKYKDVTREIQKRGHAVGIHTYSHCSMKKVNYTDYLHDIARCERVLGELDITTKLFRPPYGDIVWHRMFDMTKQRKIVMWNKDTTDYSFPDLDSAWRHLQEFSIKATDIVLFHDVYPHTPELVRRLGNKAKENNYIIDSISET